MTTEERIESNIQKDFESNCWNWLGHKNRGGYGNITVNKKILRVHRVYYELKNGIIPKGMCVCHHCDNRGCCNPEHLFLGTHQANMTDMNTKKRGNQGKIRNHKLSEEDVIKIRIKLQEGVSGYEIAENFNVKKSTIYAIKYNVTWKHVEIKQ